MIETLRQPIILGSVALYMAACLGIGWWALRRTRSTRDFFMAGRQLGVLVTGIAVFSSTMSGFGFVGGPGLVYALGMSSVWIVITTGIAGATTDFLLGKRLRMFAELFDTVSLPDVVAARYGRESTRFLAALAILLGILGYLATQMLAMAKVLQSLLQGTDAFSDVSLAACIAVSCSVLVFYCVSGGILASVYTDLVQGSIMALAGVLVFVTAVALFKGGPSSAITSLWNDDPASVSPWGTLGMIGCLSWYFLFAVGSSGQPHVITKGMMIKSLRSYRFIPAIAVGGFLLTALLWVGIGIAMRALVVSGRLPALASPDDAAPVFLQTFAHPLLAGIVFAGLFAAIMSTADSFLNIGAAALTHDLPRAFGRKPGNELAWARWGTVAIAALAALFALYSHYVNARLVALLGVFGWGTFAAALVPTVGIGLNWKRATPLAANVAIAASLIVNFTIEIFDLAMPFGVHGGSVALLVSLALFFALSYAAPPPTLPPDVEAVMNL
jgi:sodium/proline symporter